MVVGRAEGSGDGGAVGSELGAGLGWGEGAPVVGRLVGSWVKTVGTNVGLHVCVSGSASQQTVPRRALPVSICQNEVTLLERASTSVGTSSQSCGLGVGSGIGARVSVEGQRINASKAIAKRASKAEVV